MKKTILLGCLLLVLSIASSVDVPSAAQESSALRELPTTREPQTPQKPSATQTPTGAQNASTAQTSAATQNTSTSQQPSALELLKLSLTEMQRQDSLLAGYCYLKTVVVEFLDNNFSAKKSEERLVEVTSIPHGPDVEVLVAVDGKRISEKERQKREAEQRQRAQGGTTQLNLSSEDLIAQFEWSFGGAEKVNGRAATILHFRPKPGAVYKGSDPKADKFMKKVGGRVWVDDGEHAISRIEFKSTEPVKSAGGLLWTLNSLYVREERKRLAEGVWIDSTGEYFVDATALLVKRIVRRSIMNTHDYRKCSDTKPDTEPVSVSQ
jgi:hypothetical protein